MTHKKLLQTIAEKTQEFDRAHFDDDSAPTVDAILSNHERLPADSKLITRLRPRYAASLAFFEGYARAVVDFMARIPNIVDPRDGTIDLDRFAALVDQWRVDAGTHLASGGFYDAMHICANDLERTLKDMNERRAAALGIGIVRKPPPPPPPPAAPIPNELRTGVDDELAQAAADCANANCPESIRGVPTGNDVLYAKNAMKEESWRLDAWQRDVRTFVAGAQWQLSRIENKRAGDDPTMHMPLITSDATIDWGYRNLVETVAWGVWDGDDRFVGGWHEATDREREQCRKIAGVIVTKLTAFYNVLLKKEDSENSGRTPAPFPSFFRDDNERDFWDKEVHLRSRRGDLSSADVARAADEMVEERRVRMRGWEVNVVERVIFSGHLDLQSLLTDWENLRNRTHTDFTDGVAMCTKMLRTAIERKPNVDDLLLRAARAANRLCDESPDNSDLKYAKRVIEDPSISRWAIAVNAYLMGTGVDPKTLIESDKKSKTNESE